MAQVKELTDNTAIVMCTLGDLKRYLFGEDSATSGNSFPVADTNDEMGFGVQSIMDTFKCSRTYANKLKDGILKPAIYQTGHKGRITVNLTLAKKLIFKSKQERA